jgi:hypothetical protein
MDLDNPKIAGLLGTRPLNPALRLEAVPYEPDGGFPVYGLLVVFACIMVTAVGLGYAASWVRQWFYIILLFPFLIGVVLGVVGAIGIYIGNIRNLALATLAGLFGSCLAILAVHYFDYERFLAQPVQEKVVPAKKGLVRVVQANHRDTTFFEYLDDRARKGIPVHFRRIHFNLGYIGSYIYWVVEVLIVSVLVVAIMRGCAADPFCGQCQSWKEKRALGTLTMAPETAVHIFTEGEVVRLADHDFPHGEGQIHITAWVCKDCGSEAPVDLKVDQVRKNAKNEEEVTELVYLTYPGKALPVLMSLFAPAGSSVASDADETPIR